MSFKKLNTNLYEKKKQHNAESKFWRKFTEPVLLKEFGPIDYISFLPNDVNNEFAVTSSAHVQLFNPATKTREKSFGKFKSAAYGGSFNKIGGLMCAGSEDGQVRLYTVENRTLLRLMKGHKNAVHRTFFTSDGKHIASFSDDKTVGYWDNIEEKIIHSFNEHSDYVRSGCVSPNNENIIVSGGYDSIVNLYDVRDKSVICTLDHGAPVESCLFHPSGSIFITAGGREVRIWDAISRTLLTKCPAFHKTVTCMCFARKATRLVMGSLDHRVKIFDLSSYKVVHTMNNYHNPILSVAISADNKVLVTGSVNSIITIQKVIDPVESIEKKSTKTVAFKFRSDTSTKNSDLIDTVVKPLKKDALAKYETNLRKFQYHRALDTVMVHQIAFKTPHAVVSVFDELIKRRGLHNALKNRDSKQIAMILKFLIRYIHIERFSNVLIEVAHSVLDLYSGDNKLNQSNENKKLITQLHLTVMREAELTEQLLKLHGCLELIFSSSVMTHAVPTLLEDSSQSKTNTVRNTTATESMEN